MNSLELDLNFIDYEEFDEEKILEWEKLGEVITSNLEHKKKIIKSKIAQENLKIIEQKVLDELESDEAINIAFKANVTAAHYLNSILFSADYYLTPIAFINVGFRFIVYASDNKVMIYETRELNKLQKEYVVKYSNIYKYYYKNKKDHTKLCFKIKEDKYNELRESSSWILYGYFQGRINMIISSEDREKIAKFFDDKINARIQS